MTIVEITGGMLRAARSLTGLSQQELAERTGLCRHQVAMSRPAYLTRGMSS
jgi:transcriptional regulator with XRE-family HTH domain